MSGKQPTQGQRGVSPVAGNAKPLVSRKTLSVGVLAVAACVMGILLWKNSNPPQPPEREKLPAELGAVLPYQAPKMVIPPQSMKATPVAAVPIMPHFAPPPKPVEPAPLVLPQRDPIARLTSNVATPPPAPPKPYMLTFADPVRAPDADAAHAAGGRSGAGPASGVIYASSSLDGMKAGLLGDDTLLLKPGLLPCVMDTAINSTFEGPIQCHITADIKPHGVTLLDRGSTITGMYKNNVQTGQARLFVQADEVIDPVTGCFIKFDNAPISDGIGQAGIAGNVDNHYLERFGAAMLLTLGETSESLAQAAISKGGNTYLSFNGSGGGLDTIASTILQKQINIPPTITVHQGDEIAVFVTKILDFSPCYSLKIKDR